MTEPPIKYSFRIRRDGSVAPEDRAEYEQAIHYLKSRVMTPITIYEMLDYLEQTQRPIPEEGDSTVYEAIRAILIQEAERRVARIAQDYAE